VRRREPKALCDLARGRVLEPQRQRGPLTRRQLAREPESARRVERAVGGRCRKIVRDGVGGVLVPPKDPESLAQAVLALMKEPEKALKMGLAGRARVEREFGLQAMVERYEQVYLDLLERKKVRLEPR